MKQIKYSKQYTILKWQKQNDISKVILSEKRISFFMPLCLVDAMMLYAFHSKQNNIISRPVLLQQDHWRMISCEIYFRNHRDHVAALIVANLVNIHGLLFCQLVLEFPLRGSSLVANGLRVINFV